MRELIENIRKSPMTGPQEGVFQYMQKEGRVIGVGRPIGVGYYGPVVSFGRMPPAVIDEAGHYQMLAKSSFIGL